MITTPEYEGPPWRWVSRDGVPADCLGGWEGGLPSFEHEETGFVIFEIMLAACTSDGAMMLTSPWYGVAVILAPDGMVPLHHGPDALWEWRPNLYRRSAFRKGWNFLSSQRELGWRKGLADMQFAMWELRERFEEGEDVDPDAQPRIGMQDADDKAEELLAEQLKPQQIIEWRGLGCFRVHGGQTGHLYRITVGDGFARVHPVTDEVLESFCLHPEEWIPSADVALATMLNLTAPELEEATLEGARSNRWFPDRAPFPEEVVAERLERERELIPA